jgi:hypothetical protein
VDMIGHQHIRIDLTITAASSLPQAGLVRAVIRRPVEGSLVLRAADPPIPHLRRLTLVPLRKSQSELDST